MSNTAKEHTAIIHDAQKGEWLRFRSPVSVLTARDISEVIPLLEKVESEVNGKGLCAAGFVGYEAAGAFDPALTTLPCDDFPLVQFALYENFAPLPAPQKNGAAPALSWRDEITEEDYNEAISVIKKKIASGATYQVNFTTRLHADFEGDAQNLFASLAQAQKSDYCAFIETDDFAICSASPELFFSLNGTRLESRPMKGTAARGLTLQTDADQAEWLRSSEKNLAENAMIVDMIRNDMGRVADFGSVKVTSRFDCERYPSLWQMTSTVDSTTSASLTDIFKALFPCASITGAPKAKTMEIIGEIEKSPRRIYTGAIGFILPQRRAQFNVAIRTVLVDKNKKQAEYGVGGGIVWDSTSAGEFAECRTKAQILLAPPPEFDLLETILWEPASGYYLMDRHLKRLSDSAAYFGIKTDAAAITELLESTAASLPRERHRIRLLVSQTGEARVESYALAPNPETPARVALAKNAISSGNVFLYHKTTARDVYAKAKADAPELDDVILFNERGEITESTIANVVIEKDGKRYTPPVPSGLLAGTFRQELLESGEISERRITLAELAKADAIFLINSVRGWRRAELAGP
ncbi:MAG: aminodeoxychorismate synthase component I [Planctomycetes bacterium]|nr:aminodeoxychorismate synthase component I [Planctomycetota bacterium]